MDNPLGPMWDVLKQVTPQPVVDKFARLSNLTSRADAIAEENFPNSARDSSQKNAFRHALGTGMLTHELGGGYIAEALAKRAGNIWEGIGLQKIIDDPKHRVDSQHDTNANALGAYTARNTHSQADLVNALRKMAWESKEEAPPSFWQASPGYMTRTVK